LAVLPERQPPTIEDIMKRVQSWLLCAAFGGVAVIAACQSGPTTAMVKSTSSSVRPPCVLGCHAPDIIVTAALAADTVTFHDSTYVTLTFHVTNDGDTSVDIATEATSSCPDHPLRMNWLHNAGNASDPAELILDAEQTATVHAQWIMIAPQDVDSCDLGLTAGATGEEDHTTVVFSN
jgi:hypothetical protein